MTFVGFACQSSSANFFWNSPNLERHSDVVFTIFAVLLGRLLFWLLWNPYLFDSFCKKDKSQVVLSPIFPWFNPLPHVYMKHESRVELRYRKNTLRVHYTYWAYDGHSGTGTSYILPSGSNSVEILRRCPLPWVLGSHNASQLLLIFWSKICNSDFCWLSNVSGTGVYNQGILLAAALGYTIYFLPELFGIPSPGSLGVSLRILARQSMSWTLIGIFVYRTGNVEAEHVSPKKREENTRKQRCNFNPPPKVICFGVPPHWWFMDFRRAMWFG